jgi:molecular chaperone GrpE
VTGDVNGSGPDAPGSEHETNGAEVDLDDDAASGDAEADAVTADLAALMGERDQMRELAQRVQADFENYRKRMLREQTSAVERASEGLVQQLLPVLDTFDLAMRSLADVDEGVRKGVELVFAELAGVLERAGVERIASDGEPFDPTLHDAVMRDEGEGDAVVETLRPGYRFKGKVLRPAMVRVGPGELGESRDDATA